MKIKRVSEINEAKNPKDYKIKFWDWKEDGNVMLKDVAKQLSKWSHMCVIEDTGDDNCAAVFSNRKISKSEAIKLWENQYED